MNTPSINNENTIRQSDFGLASSRRGGYVSTIPISDAISPKDLLNSISRNKRLILGIVFSFFVLALGLLFVISPRYTADTLLMLENREGKAIGLAPSIADQAISKETIESEIEIIKSRALARKVIKLLSLQSNSDFNSFLKGNESDLDPLNENGDLSALEKLFSGQDPDGDDDDNQDEAKQMADILNHYFEGLSVTRKGISRVINIQYTTKDPITAQKIANAISDQYIQRQREIKYLEAVNVTKWLNERIKPLQKKLAISETAVENFRIESGLFESKGMALTSQQLTKLNNQLILTEQKYDESNARLNQINQLINSSQGADTFSEVRKSPLVQHLRVKEAKLQQELSELLTKYRIRHPAIVQLKAELKDINEHLSREVLDISSNLKNEAQLAKRKRFDAQKRLNELKLRLAASNDDTIELRAMEREAEANRTLLKTLISRLKEASAHKGMDVQQPNVRILSRAITPVDPSYPKKVPILALVLIGSAILAMLFVLINESLDRGLYTVGLVQEQTGLPSLGYIPAISKKNMPLQAYQVKSPQSKFSGAIRALYTGIILSNYEKPPKSILVTSAKSQEGKTTVANTLAISRALVGQKTIILDTDLRMAKVNKAFGIELSPGLVELLNGDAVLEDVIYNDVKTGTDIIPAGLLQIQNPADLLMSKGMDALLKKLNETYDLIVLDSPPILDATDARILMSKVDATIFVARWNHTKRRLIREALRNIAVPDHNIAGVVLNIVDEKKQASYGYGGADYAYGRLPHSQA